MIILKSEVISEIQSQMKPYVNQGIYLRLTQVLICVFDEIEIVNVNQNNIELDNFELLEIFLSAKKIEGCSNKTIHYYRSTINRMFFKLDKKVENITTNDLRNYLTEYSDINSISKTTIDNVRRILSSFFAWLEDEGYILKNPVKRIHRVKTPRIVKDTFTDENFETLCNNCSTLRDLTIIELLISTGMRIGELVQLNINDIDFNERECIVLGKGEAERVVYFDARCKLHLLEYLNSRTDSNPALFVSVYKPFKRLGINGVEVMLKKLGAKSGVENVHPHKFRRTFATNAIDKGMPIEQVQKLLGHLQIDTTMRYAMVNQSNVKNAHRKFMG